jgi:mannan endo-1,4-beta-mannosidase
MKTNTLKFLFVFIVLINASCSKSELNNESTNLEFVISGTKILHNTTPIQLIGANALHTFGGDSNDMNSWNMDVVREFVGNIKENPILGNPLQDSKWCLASFTPIYCRCK